MATILRCDHCGSPVDTREYAQRACAQCGSMLAPPALAPAPAPAPILYALPSPAPRSTAASTSIVAVFVALGMAALGVGTTFFVLAVRGPTVPARPTPVPLRAAGEPVRPTVTAAPETPPARATATATARATTTPTQKPVKADVCAQAAAACAEDPRSARCSTLQAKCTP